MTRKWHIGRGETVEAADEGEQAGDGLDGVEGEFAEPEQGFEQFLAVAPLHAFLQFKGKAGDGGFFELAAEAALTGDAAGEAAGIAGEGAAVRAICEALSQEQDEAGCEHAACFPSARRPMAGHRRYIGRVQYSARDRACRPGLGNVWMWLLIRELRVSSFELRGGNFKKSKRQQVKTRELGNRKGVE